MSPSYIVVSEQSIVAAPPELFPDGRLSVYPQVADKDYFRPRIGTRGLELQAGNHVGVIPLNDNVVLHVVPRVSLTNMARLLSTVNHTAKVLPGLSRFYDSDSGLFPSLVALYSASLRTSVESLSQAGLLRRYYRLEADFSWPRGRIDVTRTMQTAAPRRLPYVSTHYFERSHDTPENQALLAAVHWLSQYASKYSEAFDERENRQVRRDLNRCSLLLNGITHDPHHRFLDDPVVTGRESLPMLRQDYRSVLDLALTILRQQAVTVDAAGEYLRLPPLLIDMTELFEDYVRQVLRAAAEREDWTDRVLDGNLQPPVGGASRVFRDEAADVVAATPDIVCRRRSSSGYRFPVVIDAKYKPVGRRVERDHLNQVLTYGLAYEATHAVIVQPYGDRHARGLRWVGTVGGITVHIYGIDLAGDLDAEEAAFAEAVRRLCLSVPD